METTAISEKKQEIFEAKERAQEVLTRENHINDLLDKIIESQEIFNTVNDVYEDLFKRLDDLSNNSIDEDSDSDDIKEILDTLQIFNTHVSRLFARVMKMDILRKGCKSCLTDLRINIRVLREYLNDLEEKFFLSEEDSELEELLSELA